MSAFGITALALTAAYVIYYSFIIARDMRGIVKLQQMSDHAEEFAIDEDDDVEEIATAVEESDNGFSVGDEVYDRPVAQPATPQPDTVNEEKDNPAQKKADAIIDEMEASEADFEARYTSTEFLYELTRSDAERLNSIVKSKKMAY